MYRSVLALLFAAVLLLSGCAVGRQTVPKEKSGQETNMGGPAFDRSDEEITYMDTTDNVIYLAPARRTPIARPSARERPAFGRPCGWNTTPGR